MTANEIQEAFLLSRSPLDNKIDARALTGEELKHLALVYMESSGLPVILIEAREGYIDFDELKGIGIGNKSYTLEGIKETRFYEYRCKHEKFQIIFFPFISDLLSRLGEGMDIISAHKTSIRLWKHCFEDPETSIMSVEKEIGLIGELWVLLNLLKINDSATEWWNGPSGGIDFQVNTHLIEVKTTLKKYHHHTINGLAQLDDKEGFNLNICSIILEQTENDDSNSYSLADIHHSILQCIQDDPVQTDIYRMKIGQLNISQEIMELHDFRKYYINQIGIYKVSDDFPRLTSKSLVNPLSGRISNIKYDVDLDGLDSVGMHEFLSSMH